MSESLSPAALVKEAKKAYQQGNYPVAAQAFEAAARGFAAQKDAVNAAEALNNQSVALLQAEDPEAALKAVEGTADVFAEAGDLHRQALALGNQAAALEALDQFDEAVTLYQQAADLLKQVGDDELRLRTMQAVSALQLRTGRQLEALGSMQAGLEDVKHLSPKQRLLKRLLNIPLDMVNKS